MSIRREPTYLSTDVWQCLLVISKSRNTTPDQLADDWLSDHIREKYPSVVEYLNEVNKLGREIIKAIGGTNDTNSHK